MAQVIASTVMGVVTLWLGDCIASSMMQKVTLAYNSLSYSTVPVQVPSRDAFRFHRTLYRRDQGSGGISGMGAGEAT